MIGYLRKSDCFAIHVLLLLTFTVADLAASTRLSSVDPELSRLSVTTAPHSLLLAVNNTEIVDEVIDPVSDSYAAEFTSQIDSEFNLSVQLEGPDSQVSCVVEPSDITEIASPVLGIIDRINVERGSYVKRGQTVARLKMDLERVNVDLFQARLEFRERALTRMQKVFKDNYVSSDEFDQAKIERDIARFELDREGELLKMKSITSPISGFVTEKYLSSGEYVESQPILKVVKINPLHVEVTALIDMLGKVKKGDSAQVFLEGPVKGPVSAVVDIVDNVIDPASGTFGIRLKLPNPKHSIPSGVKCRVDWDI